MPDKSYNVLFLCTGNSARSIMAEALLNHWGKNKFHAFSAGSHPTGKVNPMALEMLERMRIPYTQLSSKDWSVYAQPDSPSMDFVFTVCDNAAGEVCPVWPGQPISAHWGINDPVTRNKNDKLMAFRYAFKELESRIKIFTSLPIEKLDRIKLQEQLDKIGSTEFESA